MMNPVPWLQMTNMISYQGLVRTFPKCCFLFHLSVSISNFPTVYPTRSAIDRFKRIFPHSPRVNADLSSSSWQTSRRNYCDHALEEYVDKIFV
ncbi:hypothetical protein, partial [Klebsiella pneumoniae]|uniref:hypothetical protein n=1 Tax=Klebsiella pneumoniae TaxID=573 RepID=UPI0039A6E9A9